MRIIVLLLAGLLAGCSLTGKKEPPVIQNQIIVISPPENLFNCPQLGKVPSPETLTNKQLADIITKLIRYNRTCGINMNAIHEYVTKAQEALQEKESKK